MAITEKQKSDVVAFLEVQARAAGDELTPELFPVLLFENWDTVIDPRLIANAARDAEVAVLEDAQATRDQDAIDADAQIAGLKDGSVEPAPRAPARPPAPEPAPEPEDPPGAGAAPEPEPDPEDPPR
jgi:hypothetical protein